MPKISPLSVIHPTARLDDDVEIGPFCNIGANVDIGAGTRLLSHVTIVGQTRIGKNNTIHQGVVLGGLPQDLKYRGEVTGLIVGDNNKIRENVTMHVGTAYGSKVCGGGTTRVGDGNLFMVNSHIGHDSQIGCRCLVANNVMLAGHIILGNNVVLNGGVGLNPWVSIGDFAYVDSFSAVHHDVPPYIKTSDDVPRATNKIGLQRGGISEDDIDAIDQAARQLFFLRGRGQTFAQSLSSFDTRNGINPHVKSLIEFLRRRNSGKHGRYLEGLRPPMEQQVRL